MMYCNSRFLGLGVSVIVWDFYDGMSHMRLFASWTFRIARCFEMNTSNKNKYYVKAFIYYLFLPFLLILKPQIMSKIEEVNNRI
jgi:hypothetical protein